MSNTQNTPKKRWSKTEKRAVRTGKTRGWHRVKKKHIGQGNTALKIERCREIQ